MPSGEPGGTAVILENLAQQRLPARRMVAGMERASRQAVLLDLDDEISEADALPAIARHDPALVVVSQLFSHMLPRHLTLLDALRRSGCGAHLCLAGDLAGMAAAELLGACPALDSVLAGGHEHALPALAAAACRGADLAGVPGLSWRRGGIRTNPPAPGGLDDGPWPAYPCGLPEWDGIAFCTVEAGRGCRHGCVFCLPSAACRRSGQAYRLRSVGSVCDELEERQRAGARLVLFDDEQFLPPEPLRAARVAELGGEMARRGLRLGFTIKSRPDEVQSALFAALRQAGLIRVYLGVESNCQAVLDRLGKGFEAAANRRALEELQALELVADFRILLFHPWSTVETIRQEIDALQDLLDLVPSCLTFWEVEVYPGTPLARGLAGEGRPVPTLEPLGYAIPDPAAEWLRGMHRLVFGGCGPYQSACRQVTADWFATLLAERGLRGPPVRRRGRIRALAGAVNEAVLAVWRELLEVVIPGAPLGPAASMDLAASLSGQLAASCARSVTVQNDSLNGG